MKAKKLFVLIIAMMLPVLSFAQSRLMSDLSDDKNIKTTYISKTMLKLASGVLGNSVDLAVGSGIDLNKVLDSVNTIEIVSTEKKGKVKKIQKAVDKLKKKYDLQPLAEVPDNSSNKNKSTQILCETDDYTGLVSKMFYINKEKSRMQVIILQGSINISDLLK
jgi:hypothetical protein